MSSVSQFDTGSRTSDNLGAGAGRDGAAAPRARASSLDSAPRPAYGAAAAVFDAIQDASSTASSASVHPFQQRLVYVSAETSITDADLGRLERAHGTLSRFEQSVINLVFRDKSITSNDAKHDVVSQLIEAFQSHGIDTKETKLDLSKELSAISDLMLAADDGINNIQRTKTYFKRQYGQKWYDQLVSLLNDHGKVPTLIKADHDNGQSFAFVNKPFMDLWQAIDVLDVANTTELDVKEVLINGQAFTAGQLAQIKRVPNNIARLNKLTEVDFSGVELTQLPSSLFTLGDLTKLDLQGNKLSYLPHQISQLRQLIGINLNGNSLDSLPDSLSKLTQLVDLLVASNNLQQLPSSLTQINSLERLVVSNNQLTELPKLMGALSNLTTLSVDHNNLSKLPKTLFEIEGLTHLNVGHNQLAYMQEEIKKLTALESLIWSHNGLDGLPTGVRFLVNLERVDLSHNVIKEITDHFTYMQALKCVDFSHNQIEVLPNAFGDMTHLTELYLTDNSLTALPAGLKEFVNLTAFNADYNSIDPILARAFSRVDNSALQINVGKQIFVQNPDYAKICHVLTALGVDMQAQQDAITDMRDKAHADNIDKKVGKDHFDYQYGQTFEEQLVNLAREFGGRLARQINADPTITKAFVTPRFVTLRQDWQNDKGAVITLSGETDLFRLPSNISNSPNLTTLNVTSSALESLPSSMGTLGALDCLNVQGNKIQSLPLALTACRALTRLNVVDNALIVLPAMLSNLQQLTKLKASHNKLTALPDELCGLAQLTKLKASHNQIGVLPAELGNLVALTKLDVAHNRLREFPVSILELTALKVLDATSNNVTLLPVGFGAKLPNLTTLNMKDNQLKSLPVDVGLMAALQSLDVENHRAKSWPAGTRALTNLTTVTTKTTYTRTVSGKNVTRLDPDLTGSPAARLISNTALGGIAMTAEYAAITAMRNGAAGAGSGLSGPDRDQARKYFDLQYGATPAEQYRALQDEFPGMTMQDILADGNIKKAFVTPTFIAEWEKISDGITGNEYKLQNDKTLYRIPSNLAMQKAVTKIDLAGCNIQAIPAFVTQMRLLTSLYLRDNDLRTVPDALNNLTHLRILGLDHNKLTTLPDLSALVNLTTFGAANNSLTQFPAWLAAHTTVQKVYIGNDLSAVGAIPNLTGMTALQELYLDGSKLKSVPANLPAGLTTLSLSNNAFTSGQKIDVSVLPVSLKTLDLSYNTKCFTTLPAGHRLNIDFSALINLKKLDLSNCGLQYTSKGFVLPNFDVTVDCSNNDFFYYPEMRQPKPGASGTGHYVRADIDDPEAKNKLIMSNNPNFNPDSTFGRWFYN